MKVQKYHLSDESGVHGLQAPAQQGQVHKHGSLSAALPPLSPLRAFPPHLPLSLKVN